jgi:hypothetical protein
MSIKCLVKIQRVITEARGDILVLSAAGHFKNVHIFL